MKRNYSDTIKSKASRTLTAKGYKFIWKCIGVIAMQRNLNKYSKELKPVKEKLYSLMEHLLIDEEKTIDEIKEMVKNRNFDNRLAS